MKSLTLPVLLFALLWGAAGASALAQAGTWVLDGWPHEKNGFFAGRTVVHADGDRLKITEWPENSEDDAESMETYFLGRTGIKVFTWNEERIGLVFESDQPLPRAEFNSEGTLLLPSPFPSCVGQETEMSCGEGCIYHVRNTGFTLLDPIDFAPGGSHDGSFTPGADVVLMSRDEFLERYRISPPEWTAFH